MLHEIDFGLNFGELSVQATQKHLSHHLVKLVLKEEKFLVHFYQWAESILAPW